MAQIVLRQGARVAVHVGRYWLPRDAEDARDFGANGLRDFSFAQSAQPGIGGASRKAGEGVHSFRRASGEKRGVEYRAENAQAFCTRDQEAKSVGGPADLFAAIACR